MRAFRNTKLNFGLVSAEVSVYPTTAESDVKFHLCDPDDGSAVEQVYRRVDNKSIIGSSGDCGRAFNGTLIPNDAITAITDKTKMEGDDDLKQFNVQRFVPLSRVPYERITGSYYVAPAPQKNDAKNRKNFATIMAAMENKGLAAVCKWIPGQRQEQMILWPQDGILMAVKVAMRESVCDYGELRVEDETSPAEVSLAERLIEMYTDPEGEIIDTMQDSALVERRELVERFVKTGEKPAAPVAADEEKKPATDLMDALVASLEAAKA